MAESSSEPLAEAWRHVRRKRIFYIVLGIWIALSLMWFAIDKYLRRRGNQPGT
jgi:hypothetical protein